MTESQSLRTPTRHARLLAFSVTGTGVAAIVEGRRHATLVDNGVGDYTLTFAQQFGRTPGFGIGLRTSETKHQISALSKSAIRIKIFAADGVTPKDGSFDLHIAGSDARDE